MREAVAKPNPAKAAAIVFDLFDVVIMVSPLRQAECHRNIQICDKCPICALNCHRILRIHDNCPLLKAECRRNSVNCDKCLF